MDIYILTIHTGKGEKKYFADTCYRDGKQHPITTTEPLQAKQYTSSKWAERGAENLSKKIGEKYKVEIEKTTIKKIIGGSL